MGEHRRSAVADAVNEQHGGQIDEYLNKKVRGDQNGYLGKLDAVLRLECQKQQRREIVDDRLNDELVIDLTDLPDDLILPSVYAATGFATDVIVQNGDVGTALLSDELWKLLGANSNPLAADYTMRMVKLIRSQGGIAGVTSQGMADMMALDGGKYGKAILDSCRIKFIMQMEEQEARLVQNILNLTEEEVRLITRFRRGEGLLCIGHNHVPISVFVSPKEYEAITTSPTDRRARNNA